MAAIAGEQIRALEDALGALLPAADRAGVAYLAAVVARVARGDLAAPDLAEQVAAAPPVGDLLVGLQGQRVAAGGVQISFGSGSQIGDITTGDIVGRDKITFNLLFGAIDPSYDVRRLTSPYRGLEPFTYDDSQCFAGRGRLIRQAVEALTAPGGRPTILFITGSSGSGKSSLAQAGIVPALAAHYQGEGRAVRRAVMRPGERPLEALDRALERLGIAEATEAGPGWVSLLVIDQAEELFTQALPAERDALIARLAAPPPFEVLPLQILITLRSDYLPQLFAYPDLYALVKAGVDVYAMGPDELEEAILLPIRRLHPDKGMEPALAERLVRDAAGDSARLPLLQVALRDLWRRGALTLASYGGLADAIRERGDAVLAYADYDGARQLPRDAPEREAMLALLLDLVDVSLDSARERDVRRRRPVEDVTRRDARRARLLEELVAARLLSRWSPLQGDAAHDTVDIVHESLIAHWGALRDAVTRRRTELQQRARFELALRLWQEDRGRLLTGAALAEAEELAGRDDVGLRPTPARELLRLSVAAREAEQLRQLEAARELADVRAQMLALAWALIAALAAAALAAPGLWALDRMTAWVTAAPLEPLRPGAVVVAGREVGVGPLLMERYEVANWQYQRCVDWRGCTPLAIGPPADGSRDGHPVVRVNAFQAAAYCRWVGRRLPTAAEWALAARGPQGAWYLRDGGELNRSLLNISFPGDDPALAGTRPVTDYPAGATDAGVFNLAGNVVEWTATAFAGRAPDVAADPWGGTSQGPPEWLTLAGSGYTDTVESLMAGDYLRASPAATRPDLGFRCVVTQP